MSGTKLKIHVGELPDAVAVYVAHVPPTNHCPALIKQPVCVPLVNPFKYPDPDKVPGLPLAEMLEVVFVTDINVVLVLEVIGTVGVAEVLGTTRVLDGIDVDELGGGAGLPDLRRYFTPVAGHVDFDPSEVK